MSESKSLLLAGLVGVVVGGLLVCVAMVCNRPMMMRGMRHMDGDMEMKMMGGKHSGMGMSMNDMTMSLSDKTGDEFDKAFLETMIIHHEGAVDMANEVKRVSKRPELLKLADEIISAQTKEISMMQGWLSTWFK